MDSSILFLLIFFIFAILQGIGQKRRQVGDQGQPPPTGTGEDGAPGQGGERSQAASRERAEATRRERVRVAPRERAEATRRERVQPAPQPTQQRERSSEGLIPGDIWEEILGLARGETPRPKPPVEPVPPSPPLPAESREGAVPRKPSAASILRRAAPPVAPVPSEAASAVAAQTRRGVRAGLFGDGSARELRKAVVLKEVLGPPVALKE